jgi:hypothetical protein
LAHFVNAECHDLSTFSFFPCDEGEIKVSSYLKPTNLANQQGGVQSLSATTEWQPPTKRQEKMAVLGL